MNAQLNSLHHNPLFPILIAGIIYGIFILARLNSFGFDPSGFIVAGDYFVTPQMPILINPNSHGYDGEFYYRYALSPFLFEPTAYGITLDYPSFRHQRILYPLLAWFFSIGKNELIPWALILVNFLALIGITYFGAKLAIHFNKSAWAGLLFGLYPGLIMGLARDLTEPVSSFFIIAGIYFFYTKKSFPAALAFGLAILAREFYIFIPIGIFIYGILNQKLLKEKNIALCAIIPLVVFIVWQLFLTSVWGKIPLLSGSGVFGLPFIFLLNYIWTLVTFFSAWSVFLMLEIFFIIIAACAALVVFIQSKNYHPFGLALFLFMLAMSLMNQEIWVEDMAYVRMATGMMMLSFVLLLENKSIKWKWFLAMMAPLTLTQLFIYSTII